MIEKTPDPVNLNADSRSLGLTLESIMHSAERLKEVSKSSLNAGDWILVKTVRSLYQIHSLGDGLYEVSGGWFTKKGLSSAQIRISGCTWGGSAIKIDVMAALGLRIEFSNRLTTSPVQKIFVLRYESQN